MNFPYKVGDKVKLTDAMKKAAVEPEKYQEGIITTSNYGAWNVVEVKWNGIDHPICMRKDEITLL